jgi:hypothetical protein
VLQKFLAGVDVWRRQDPVDVGRGVLKKRRGRNLVRELCEIEGKEVVQSGDQEEVEAYRRSAMLSTTTGGAAVSGSEWPGGNELGFWDGSRAGREGVL